MRALFVAIPLSFCILHAQTTTNTSCTLYPGAAYCTSVSNDNGAAVAQARQQQYETGQAIGSSIGMAIFGARFPGWRRGYCSKHPGQPFSYGNARGDSITGTCPNLNGLANEAAAEFLAKHPGSVRSSEHAAAIDKYIAENQLPSWESKSYDKALKAVPVPAVSLSQPQVNQQVVSNSSAKDLFVWFDEPLPAAGATLFEVVVTARAYDGALAILRQARQGNTSVQAGSSVLDTNYHPSTESLSSWRKDNPNSAPSLFYWQGENPDDTTPVMHFEMTKRAYEQMLALVAGSDLRVRPSEASDQRK